MKPVQVFCGALTSAAFLACQDATQPRRDRGLVASQDVTASAATIDATAPVHLHPHAGVVTTTESIGGSSNVTTKFQSVDQACLSFEFSGDLLDPGDDFVITVDGADAGGFFNSGTESQATRTFCWNPANAPGIVAELMDGKAKLAFITRSGSITLSSVMLTISGSPL